MLVAYGLGRNFSMEFVLLLDKVKQALLNNELKLGTVASDHDFVCLSAICGFSFGWLIVV